MIGKQCPNCLTLAPVPHLGVNPCGLMPNQIWQMDVTHYAEFLSGRRRCALAAREIGPTGKHTLKAAGMYN